ncbi:metalloregulator ArsR/SmtB family transcription factor [Candidatus Micrarchaeota archaeon]|nr:metalloregulator ArsR/SmtB family transcription factor [Candidatus Micrarchaeota archaeon]MBU1166591.1 metalloregulator ArsR/SmtB family transcription factor [Candidatus Micrarchaeota archaeon]MBU1887277.1 metalloregulator ArsR/SmtB family transcription factor [Candidatus Micrarchaeota archaeon]
MNTDILKAISDQTRLKLLEKISKKEICACKLPDIVNKTQPAVSQHLKVLLDSKLVRIRKDGTMRLYSITNKGKQVLSDILRW